MSTKFLITTLMMIGLTGCKQEFSGSLSINSPIALSSKQGQQIKISPGKYNSKIKISSKNKLDFVLISNAGEFNFPFKTSQNLKNIISGTRVFIPTSESGQPYNVEALFTSTVTNSPPYRNTESCYYYRNEYRCENIYIPPTCHIYNDCSRGACVPRETCTPGRHEQRCGYVSVPYSGFRQVEYFISTTTSSVSGNLKHPANNAPVAGFSVADQDSVKNYAYQGICY